MASKSELDSDKLLSLAEGCRRVLIRLPDGLLHHAPIIIDVLQSAGIGVIISVDACYGACDWSGSHTNVDKIIYIGEAPMPSLEGCYPVPALFLPVPTPHDVIPAVEEALPLLSGSVVGVVTITPYINQLSTAVKRLEQAGFTVIMGEKSRRVAHDGQILGCDLTAGSSIASQVDCFLYIGDGMFHPLGLALTTEKPVIVANPAERRALRQEFAEKRDALLKRRYAQIARAEDGHRVGIIIGNKLGQHRAEMAERLKEMAERHGYQAVMVTADVLQPERLDHLGMDFYVSTACPRVAIDDAGRFKQPLLTPIEFEILIGERDWSEYEFDQIV